MKKDGILSLVKSRFAAYRRQQADYRALAGMSARELRDIGLGPDDVVAILNGSFQADATRRRASASRATTKRMDSDSVIPESRFRTAA